MTNLDILDTTRPQKFMSQSSKYLEPLLLISRHFPWYLYFMVAQDALRTAYRRFKLIDFDFDVKKCLKQIKKPNSLLLGGCKI